MVRRAAAPGDVCEAARATGTDRYAAPHGAARAKGAADHTLLPASPSRQVRRCDARPDDSCLRSTPRACESPPVRTRAYAGCGAAARGRRWPSPCTHGPSACAGAVGRCPGLPADSAKAPCSRSSACSRRCTGLAGCWHIGHRRGRDQTWSDQGCEANGQGCGRPARDGTVDDRSRRSGGCGVSGELSADISPCDRRAPLAVWAPDRGGLSGSRCHLVTDEECLVALILILLIRDKSAEKIRIFAPSNALRSSR